MQRLLGEMQFRDAGRALEHILRISQDTPQETQDRLRSLLAAAADPDQALRFLEGLHRDQPAAFRRLVATPTGLQLLVTVCAQSCFLAEAIQRHPDWLEDLLASGDLERVLLAEEYERRLEQMLGPSDVRAPAARCAAKFTVNSGVPGRLP